MTLFDLACETCADRILNGRGGNASIHCRHCHRTWTGNEAQHCVKCHHTFSGITAADSHRYRRLQDGRNEDRCIDPNLTDGWREIRPGVWTDAEQWNGPS